VKTRFKVALPALAFTLCRRHGVGKAGIIKISSASVISVKKKAHLCAIESFLLIKKNNRSIKIDRTAFLNPIPKNGKECYNKTEQNLGKLSVDKNHLFYFSPTDINGLCILLIENQQPFISKSYILRILQVNFFFIFQFYF